MQKLGFLCFLLFVPACFEPPQPQCAFRCGPAGACPDDYSCLPDGYCHLHGAAGACGFSDLSVADLTEQPDMTTIDMTSVESCTDGVKNGTETAIDCGGGTCPKCAIGKACEGFANGARDCESGRCSTIDKVCVASACNDQTMNNAETDVDCGGGTCPGCAVGKMCASLADGPRDCTSMVCSATSKVCVAAAGCSDQVKDNLETDVDCGGGGCSTCVNGLGCGGLANGVRDCASGICSATGMLCVANACLDQSKDGAETDVDCGGGTCPGCAVTKACLMGADCTSTFCSAMDKLCVATQCLDQTKNGTETAIDCGGATCNKCGDGKACLIGTDCTSGFCSATSKVCVATQCLDQTMNGTETDVDCGGATCPKCIDTKDCLVNSDCVHFCNNVTHKCIPDTCPDGVKDGTEADVDCGAPTSTCPTATCGAGLMCTADADCTSVMCLGGTMCM